MIWKVHWISKTMLGLTKNLSILGYVMCSEMKLSPLFSLHPQSHNIMWLKPTIRGPIYRLRFELHTLLSFTNLCECHHLTGGVPKFISYELCTHVNIVTDFKRDIIFDLLLVYILHLFYVFCYQPVNHLLIVTWLTQHSPE